MVAMAWVGMVVGLVCLAVTLARDPLLRGRLRSRWTAVAAALLAAAFVVQSIDAVMDGEHVEAAGHAVALALVLALTWLVVRHRAAD